MVHNTFHKLHFKENYVFNERRQTAWIIPSFWHALLCCICAHWPPSQNSTGFVTSKIACCAQGPSNGIRLLHKCIKPLA
ncbi:hypothetical protein C5167_033363 [Papaver somniferum]|uniref:Uncharacterized protein n=1 Tax=Papaver somniferum TaxID=3469 RepID=A0A4Y7KDV0_PAPSO|nr:hypothetical protein C5167_033363 [Papaver somniferum]